MQADRVIDLIFTKYLIVDISYEKEIRVEMYPFPREAVREALYNSIMHCSYAELIPIQVHIEDDAMYISNDIAFSSEWTPEKLMSRHRSMPYNPSIANVFFRAGYVETWGRGIQKMCEACQEYGCPQPEYTSIPGGIMLTLFAKYTTQSTTQTTVFKLTKLQTEVLDYLAQHPASSRRELVHAISGSTENEINIL